MPRLLMLELSVIASISLPETPDVGKRKFNLTSLQQQFQPQ